MSAVKEYYGPPDLYDVVYSDIRDDIPLWVGEARAARGRVLELACGTGRVLIPCLEAGVPIEGLDITEAMVGYLKEKLAARGLKAEIAAGDMRDFTRPHRYSLIFIAFNSFLHNLTAADQLATLRCCREHLESDGKLVINIFHPDSRKLIEHDGVPRVIKTVPYAAAVAASAAEPGWQARVTDAGRCDPVEQHIWITRQVELIDPAGRVARTHDLAFELRYIYKPEMELLLTLAGFKRFAAEPRTGYGAGFAPKPAPEEGDTLVWSAWKE